jgi:hypothetical protein
MDAQNTIGWAAAIGAAAVAETLSAQWQLLLVNVVLVGLWGLNQLLTLALSSYRRRVSTSPARFCLGRRLEHFAR